MRFLRLEQVRVAEGERLALAISPATERYFMRVWREQAVVCGVVGVFAYDTGSNAS